MLLKHEVSHDDPSAVKRFSFTTDPAKRQGFDARDMERDRTSQTASNQSSAFQSRNYTGNARQGEETEFLPRSHYLPSGMGMIPLPQWYYQGHLNTWFDSGSKRRKLMELSAAAIERMLYTMSPQDHEIYTRELAVDFWSFLDKFGITNGLRVFDFASMFRKDDDAMSQSPSRPLSHQGAMRKLIPFDQPYELAPWPLLGYLRRLILQDILDE